MRGRSRHSDKETRRKAVSRPTMKKNNSDQAKSIFTYASTTVLVGLFTLAFAWIWYSWYADTMLLPFYRRGHWVMVFIYLILVLLFSKAFGGIKVGYLRRTDMLYSQMISIVCVNLLTYLEISVVDRDFSEFVPIIVLTLVDWVILIAWVWASNKLYFKLFPPRRLVVIYGDRSAADLVMKMSRRVDKYMICESVSVHDDMEEVYRKISEYEGVILCEVSGTVRNDLIKYCFANNIRMYISPKISDIIVRGAEDIRLFDTPLLLCRNYGLTIGQRFVKRTFDLILSILMTILLSPVMAVCAIAIKVEDGGPVLFKQKRLTIGGKEFYVYKFRSMVVDAEKDGPQLSSENDDRVTKVGRVMRKCRLDELPQLFNIIKGDMSLVGPRPERPELAAEYEKEIPEFSFRLQVKAGLTGYAQVTGLYDTQPYDKLKMDLMYIENYSIFLDLQILLMTVKIALFPNESNEKAKEHDGQEVEEAVEQVQESAPAQAHEKAQKRDMHTQKNVSCSANAQKYMDLNEGK